jgi:hypothetical protein
MVVLGSGQQPIVAFHGSGHLLIRQAVALLLPGRKNFILKKTVLPSSLHKALSKYFYAIISDSTVFQSITQ